MTTEATGYALLRDPRSNKGSAFTAAERAKHGLEGLLPPQPSTLDRQIARMLNELDHADSDPAALSSAVGLAGA